MAWNADQITKQAVRSAAEDYAAFEAIGLEHMSGIRVLDAGCFDGFNTHLKFAPYRGVARVVGIDPSRAAIESARKRYGSERFEFVESSFEDYAARDGSFDVVYLSHALQHFDDPARALAKVRRLLAPGGFVIVKTTDDGAKVSYPDPDKAMRGLFDLYERHVLPETPWTAHTDRYFGRKCYTLLKRAGFASVAIAAFSDNTAGKTPGERRALFERCAYFRRNAPEGSDPSVVREIREAVERFERLFERDDYFFSTTSYVAIGQKVESGAEPLAYFGSTFGRCGEAVCRKVLLPLRSDGTRLSVSTGDSGVRTIRAMREGDIGGVMLIELESFPQPWTPLAYLSELRHNPAARYRVLVEEGVVAGYVGIWYRGDGAWITRIAVGSAYRCGGRGGELLDAACSDAAEREAGDVLLEVRASNEDAQRFYLHAGFEAVDRWKGYYADPPDDAIVMRKALSGASLPKQ